MARAGLDRKTQVNFNGGELSPLLRGRTDLDIWQRGCRQMQNMTSRKYGNAERRIGLQYIGEVKDSSKEVRLLPFQNTDNDGTIIEMGGGYFRYFKDGAAVKSGGSAYEVTNPYSNDEIFDVQFKEINDIVLMTHPDHPVQRLSHYSDTNWTMEDAPFDEPVFMDANADDDITIAPSATTGTGVTLTASSSIFTSSMVGGYFKLGQKRLTSTAKLSVTKAGTYTSSSISLKGKFTFRTSGTWEGTVLLKRYDNGTWNTVYTFESSKDQNFNQELEQSDDEYHTWEIIFTLVDKDGSPAKVYLESLESYVYGWAKITGYTSAYVVTATVESDFEDTSATNVWMEGAWSPYRGYPRTVAFFQDCMFYGGTTHQPQTFWKSYAGDYYNFEGITGVTSIQDDYAVAATMGSTERIFQKWMEILGTSVVVGTSSSEFGISGSSDGGDAITATNMLVKSDTSTGSSGVRPVRVGNAILHVQRDGKKVYELTYSLQKYGFSDSDITQFAEHVTEGCTIVDMWYSRQPDGVLYAVRSDGVLLACVYDQDQKVLAWSRFVTQGLFKSGACIHTENGDENWVVVQRTLGDGTVKKYIERFYPIEWSEQEDAPFCDCLSNPVAYDYQSIVDGTTSIPECLDIDNSSTVNTSYDEIFNDGIIDVPLGDTLIIELENNPSDGFTIGGWCWVTSGFTNVSGIFYYNGNVLSGVPTSPFFQFLNSDGVETSQYGFFSALSGNNNGDISFGTYPLFYTDYQDVKGTWVYIEWNHDSNTGSNYIFVGGDLVKFYTDANLLTESVSNPFIIPEFDSSKYRRVSIYGKWSLFVFKNVCTHTNNFTPPNNPGS